MCMIVRKLVRYNVVHICLSEGWPGAMLHVSEDWPGAMLQVYRGVFHAHCCRLIRGLITAISRCVGGLVRGSSTVNSGALSFGCHYKCNVGWPGKNTAGLLEGLPGAMLQIYQGG
jgi:hypothetical protein